MRVWSTYSIVVERVFDDEIEHVVLLKVMTNVVIEQREDLTNEYSQDLIDVIDGIKV